VPDDFGFFFYSSAPFPGERSALLGGAVRCVGGPGRALYRLPVEHASQGVLSHTLDPENLPHPGATFSPGSTWYFQAWFRDDRNQNLGVDTSFNTSNGLRVDFSPRKHKILHIIIDDVGCDVLRAYHDQNKYDGDNPFNQLEDPAGANLYPWTPFIDELASKGMRFNQFHTNPTCSTTRAALYTGRYGFRNGVGSLIGPNRVGTLGEFGVGTGNEEWTIAEVVASAGYRTGFTGKWHLALAPTEVSTGGQPGQGFPHVIDFGGWGEVWSVHSNMSGQPLTPAVHIPGVSGSTNPADDVPHGYYNFNSWATFGAHPFESEELNLAFATDLQRHATKELIDWFRMTAPSRPWYIVASFNAAHSPWEDFPPVEYLSTAEYWPAVTLYGLPVPGGSGTLTAWTGFNAQVEALDSRLRAMFDSLGGLDAVLETTTVILHSENGTPTPVPQSAVVDHGKNIGSVYPQVLPPNPDHFKHEPYEQGCKVPLIVAGPLVANPGSVSNALVDAVDIHATIAAITRADISAVVTDGRAQDGVSFLKVLRNKVTDEQHILNERSFSFMERFSPNGDPRTIVPPVLNENSRRRGYIGRTAQGWFKLVRHLRDSGLEEDGFFHLYSGTVPSIASEVDPNELVDLVAVPAYAADYAQIKLEMEALLATEP